MHCGIQEMQHPHKNRIPNSQSNEGDTAVSNPNKISNTDDIIRELRRPYVSAIKPHIGEVSIIAKKTDEEREAIEFFVTFQEAWHSNAGASTDNIIISIASLRKASPAASER